MSDTVAIMRSTPFPVTAWTQIEAAKGEDAASKCALDTLCNSYWAPVFGFISRRVPDSHKAQDLAQEFFASVVEKRTVIMKADRTQGKFRSYLSQRLKWFLLDEFKKHSIVKKEVPFNDTVKHPQSMSEPIEDAQFNRDWAQRTLDQALDRIEQQYRAEGNERRRQIFMLRRTQASASKIAEALKLNLDTVKNELRAMRKQSEAALRALVRSTVADESYVNEELGLIRQLLSVR